MNLAQLRKNLRSKIRDLDTANPDWSDSDLNIVLGESALLVQDFVNGVDPNPYTVTMYNDLVNGQSMYALPSNYRSPGIREAAIMASAGGSYSPMVRRENVVIDEARAGNNTGASNTGKPLYSISHGILELLAVPTSNVTAGLRLIFSSTIAMADDDAIPQLPLSLHSCIVLEAAIFLSPDTDDPDFEKYIKVRDHRYKTFKDSFKVVNNRDQMGIEGVGGHDRMGWGSPTVPGDTSYPRRV